MLNTAEMWCFLFAERRNNEKDTKKTYNNGTDG